jgi:predicted DsbA family dithiol-disulfide isomerase
VEEAVLDREDIFCDNCYLSMRIDSRLSNREAETYKEARQQAIETWNTRTPMANIVEKLEERERYLERAMKESHENGHRFSEEKAMNERVAIRYAINIVKQEINNGLE